MYDALLEEFEDEVIRTPDDEESLRSLPLEEVDDSDDDDLVEPPTEAEPEVQELKEDEDLLAGIEDDTETWSDDPVRMYLTQMGEIPLLTRQEEIRLARRIEITHMHSISVPESSTEQPFTIVIYHHRAVDDFVPSVIIHISYTDVMVAHSGIRGSVFVRRVTDTGIENPSLCELSFPPIPCDQY